MAPLIFTLVTFLVVGIVLYLVNLLPFDAHRRQMLRMAVLIIGLAVLLQRILI